MPNIFKIIDSNLFKQAAAEGRFQGAEIDLRDEFIHFSTVGQVQETAKLHFAGREGLVIFAIAQDALGNALKWEASRGGQLFPHYYGTLDMKLVRWARPLPWNGLSHDFPRETFQ